MLQKFYFSKDYQPTTSIEKRCFFYDQRGICLLTCKERLAEEDEAGTGQPEAPETLGHQKDVQAGKGMRTEIQVATVKRSNSVTWQPNIAP
jgi:hypothetical protein